MIPVLMSGGSGTRLWPVSRVNLPKQFCDLLGEPLQSMTLKRLAPLGRPWIVTGRALQKLTEANLVSAGVAAGETLYEPTGRNTAAAIGLLCRRLQLLGQGSEVVGVFPSDHLVVKEEAFRSAVRLAEELAQSGKVVTLGIHPDQPETGFGYIETSEEALLKRQDLGAYDVLGFHEKPTREKAIKFLAAGHFSWNAGIFVFRVDDMAQLLSRHEPEVWNPLVELRKDLSNLDEIYARVKSISIDYAVMEKIGGTGQLVCVPVDIGWSDVGSWDAVAMESRRLGTDGRSGLLRSVDSKNVFVEAPAGKIVALIGVADLNVVDTGDALLICKVGESQRVREVVEPLTREKNSVVRDPRLVEEAWGRSEILRTEKDFVTKMITIRAGHERPYRAGVRCLIVRGHGEMISNQVTTRVSGGVQVPTSGASSFVLKALHDDLCLIEVDLSTGDAAVEARRES